MMKIFFHLAIQIPDFKKLDTDVFLSSVFNCTRYLNSMIDSINRPLQNSTAIYILRTIKSKYLKYQNIQNIPIFKIELLNLKIVFIIKIFVFLNVDIFTIVMNGICFIFRIKNGGKIENNVVVCFLAPALCYLMVSLISR